MSHRLPFSFSGIPAGVAAAILVSVLILGALLSPRAEGSERYKAMFSVNGGMTAFTGAMTSMAPAGSVVCEGTVAGPIPSGVLVPAGATCVVTGGKIRGDVDIAEGGLAQLRDLQVEGSVTLSQGELSAEGSTIQGSLSGEGGAVDLQGTAVLGTTTLSNGKLSADLADFRGPLRLSGAALTAAMKTSQLREEVTVESGRSFAVESSKLARGISIGKEARQIMASIDDSQISETIRVISARVVEVDGSQVGRDLDLRNTKATVRKSTIGRNLAVSPGSSIELDRSAVKGDLKASKARIRSVRSSVGGRVALLRGGRFKAEVSRFESTFAASGPGLALAVEGSNFKKGLAIRAAKSVAITTSKVSGNLQVSRSRGPVAVEVSSIAGSVKLRGNRALRGSIRVFRNKILGSLECLGNRPAPSGGRNGVKGAKNGQCSQL